MQREVRDMGRGARVIESKGEKRGKKGQEREKKKERLSVHPGKWI